MSLKFLQTSVLVHGLRTEIVVQPYADRILVLVTQMGKVGCLVHTSSVPYAFTADWGDDGQIQASVPSTTDLRGSDAQGRLPCPSPAIQLTPIFGSAPSTDMHTLYSLYAAQTATLVWLAMGGEPRSVVVGIALERREEEQHTFRAVMAGLQNMLARG